MIDDLHVSARTAVEVVMAAIVMTLFLTVLHVTLSEGDAKTRELTNAHDISYNQDFSTLSSYRHSVPVPTIFTTLNRNAPLIKSVKGSVSGVSIKSIDDLSNVFSKKAIVTVEGNADDGYAIQVTDDN